MSGNKYQINTLLIVWLVRNTNLIYIYRIETNKVKKNADSKLRNVSLITISEYTHIHIYVSTK